MRALCKGLFTFLALWLPLLGLPAAAQAQENCEGHKPEGGKWTTSAELYLQRARQNPDPQDKQDLFRQAVEVLRDGYEHQSENPRIYTMAGQAYAGLGEYENADSAFTRAEELWSCYEGHVDTLRFNAWVVAFNTAVRYTQSQENEKAAEAYLNAWTVYKELPQPMIQLGGLYAQQAMNAEDVEERNQAQKKAIEAFGNAIQALDDPSPRLTEDRRAEYGRAAAFNLAQLLAFDGRYEEAARAYERFLEQEPGNIDALSNLAVVVTRAASEAEKQAGELEEGPEKEALVTKADSLRTMAASYYTDLLEREDLEPSDYFNLGVGLARLGHHPEAVGAFNQTLEYEPYNHDALEQLALALYQTQQYDSLVFVAQTLVERYPLDLNNMALLANAHRELDQREQALAVLEGRDTLKVEVIELDLERSEEGGEYTLSGALHNVKAAPSTPVHLVFDFYDDSGEVVASESLTIETPAQGERTEFSVSTQSSMLISGFVYRRGDGSQSTGS